MVTPTPPLSFSLFSHMIDGSSHSTAQGAHLAGRIGTRGESGLVKKRVIFGLKEAISPLVALLVCVLKVHPLLLLPISRVCVCTFSLPLFFHSSSSSFSTTPTATSLAYSPSSLSLSFIPPKIVQLGFAGYGVIVKKFAQNSDVNQLIFSMFRYVREIRKERERKRKKERERGIGAR